jgi:DNA-binding response OmpR family regulator
MANDEKRPLGKITLTKKRSALLEGDGSAEADARAAEMEVEALRVLSEQHGVPGIDLQQIAILLEHLDPVARDVAEAHLVLPVLVRDDRLFLAMATPGSRRIIDEIEFVSGKKVYAYVALPPTLRRTIAGAYDARDRGETYFLGPRVPEETLRQLGLAKEPSVPPPPTPENGALVSDDAIRRAGEQAEISMAEWGNMGSEVSTVTALPDELKAKAPPTAGRETEQKLILVVDDEDDIRKLLRRLLTEKGHRIVEAERGGLALRMVREHMPDLIILDAMLPELHGFDIARRLKGSQRYGSIPILMMSAVYRGWRVAEDLKSNYGVEDYIEKPFRISDVLASVQRLLGGVARATPNDTSGDELSTDAEQALSDGIAAYRAGDFEGAIEHLRRGVAIDPLAYRLHYHLALLYGKRGLVYEGIAELEKAVDLNPRHFPALKNLAVLYEKAGFKHRAVEVWERCVQVAPDAETRASIKAHLVELL